MEKKVQEIANRLRKNQEKNLRNYQLQSDQHDKRIMNLEIMSLESFRIGSRNRRHHLKNESNQTLQESVKRLRK